MLAISANSCPDIYLAALISHFILVKSQGLLSGMSGRYRSQTGKVYLRS
jgi:hypothetical protein